MQKWSGRCISALYQYQTLSDHISPGHLRCFEKGH